VSKKTFMGPLLARSVDKPVSLLNRREVCLVQDLREGGAQLLIGCPACSFAFAADRDESWSKMDDEAWSVATLNMRSVCPGCMADIYLHRGVFYPYAFEEGGRA
jgi:hypothetical protein